MVRIVRNNNVQLTVIVELLEGSSFPAVEYPGSNINFTFLLSKHDQPDFNCEGSWEECSFMSLNNTPEAVMLRSGINTTVSPNITIPIVLDVLFSYEECLGIKYLCVHLEVGYNSSYIELDPSNNVHCHDVASSILCKPGGMFFTCDLITMYECILLKAKCHGGCRRRPTNNFL